MFFNVAHIVVQALLYFVTPTVIVIAYKVQLKFGIICKLLSNDSRMNWQFILSAANNFPVSFLLLDMRDFSNCSLEVRAHLMAKFKLEKLFWLIFLGYLALGVILIVTEKFFVQAPLDVSLG
ncbi:MAG: hypothetical protein RL660_3051 [Bacteroidota bacterium]|jgi:hypothetical protein